jgi:hypothetical protein
MVKQIIEPNGKIEGKRNENQLRAGHRDVWRQHRLQMDTLTTLLERVFDERRAVLPELFQDWVLSERLKRVIRDRRLQVVCLLVSSRRKVVVDDIPSLLRMTSGSKYSEE